MLIRWIGLFGFIRDRDRPVMLTRSGLLGFITETELSCWSRSDGVL